MGASSSDARFQVVEAQAEDAPGISSLYRRVWREYEGELPAELLAARQPSSDLVKEWLKRDTFFIVKIGDRVVGVVGCSLAHGTCLLKRMVVNPRYRRRGLGTALTKHIIAYASSNNARKVWLDTLPKLTAAVALYRKHGFVKCGRLRKHYWGEDVELYELILS